MKLKVSSVAMLAVLLLGITTFGANFQQVRASGTICTTLDEEENSRNSFRSVRERGSFGSIHWGSGVVNESEYFNFGTGDIFWSYANVERGYFYGSYSSPTLFFADKIEDYWPPYDSYQGVEHIWEFTNEGDHQWFTQHSITFAEETSPHYTGILLIQQGGLYGAIKPKSIHDEEYVLEYDWWYDDSGGSDFSPLKPSVAISTDKFEYFPRDQMTIKIYIANPSEETIYFQWYWGIPEFSFWLPLMSAPVPSGYENTLELSLTIPYLGEDSFGNVFYVQLSTAITWTLAADAACWAYSFSE